MLEEASVDKMGYCHMNEQMGSRVQDVAFGEEIHATRREVRA